jgi:hypothetical protein
MKSSQKEQKRVEIKKEHLGCCSTEHRMVWCHPPDSPVCTGQSGARSEQKGRSRKKKPSSTINHRTVCAERLIVRRASRPMAS